MKREREVLQLLKAYFYTIAFKGFKIHKNQGFDIIWAKNHKIILREVFLTLQVLMTWNRFRMMLLKNWIFLTHIFKGVGSHGGKGKYLHRNNP